MKKLIVFILISIMILTVAGCNTETQDVQGDTTPVPVAATEVPTEVPTVEPTAEPTVEPTSTPVPTIEEQIAQAVASRPTEPMERADNTYRFSFDEDANAFDDFEEDWVLIGKKNYELANFYWYWDSDNDGILNVFDTDWEGYEYLPFGDERLPDSMDEVPTDKLWTSWTEDEELAGYVSAFTEISNAEMDALGGGKTVFTTGQKSYMTELFLWKAADNYFYMGKPISTALNTQFDYTDPFKLARETKPVSNIATQEHYGISNVRIYVYSETELIDFLATEPESVFNLDADIIQEFRDSFENGRIVYDGNLLCYWEAIRISVDGEDYIVMTVNRILEWGTGSAEYWSNYLTYAGDRVESRANGQYTCSICGTEACDMEGYSACFPVLCITSGTDTEGVHTVYCPTCYAEYERSLGGN
ncbi:MAG: PT domain-containing protein [Clostridia bacterium]|nr:PT domain-containing protein [Clostridia bacterium]